MNAANGCSCHHEAVLPTGVILPCGKADGHTHEVDESPFAGLLVIGCAVGSLALMIVVGMLDLH